MKTVTEKRKTARRGNGEGSIFQRKDGRWCARIAAGYGANGKRLRREIYGHTKKEVQDKLHELQHRKQTGTLTPASTLTVAQHLDRWLRDTARLDVRESTYDRYRDLVRLHVNPRIGGVRLQRLTASDVQAVFSTMEDADLSPRMRQFVYDVLSSGLDNAVRLGLVHLNVCGQLTRPRVEQADMQTLDEKQSRDFLRAAESDRLCALYVLSLTVGMRQGELFALQWADVDLKAGTLLVKHTLTDKGKLGPPKTKKSRRKIDLPAFAVQALWDHKAAAIAAGQAANEFVFTDTAGGFLRRQNVLRRSFRPILKAAGLPQIRPHDLRHTCATLMLAAGVDAKTVSDTLGHSSVAFTLDRYGHVLPSMRQAAAAKMNRLFTVAG